MAQKKSRRSVSEENEIETAYRSISGYKGKYDKSTSNHRISIVIALCIALVAIIVCVAAGYLYFMNADLNGIILENITVAGVDVGGMSQKEAIEAVHAATNSTYSKIPMVVKVIDSQAEIPVSCVGTLDVRGAVKDAYRFGNSGSAEKQRQEQQIAMESGYCVDLSPYLNLNEDAIRQILFDLGSNYSSTLSQTTYQITGTAPSQTLVVNIGVPEYGLDLNKLYQQVLHAYSTNTFEVTGECSMIEPNPIDLETIWSEHYVAPKDAYYDKKASEVVDGVEGYGFDYEEAKNALETAAYGTTVNIPFRSLTPSVTAQEISSMLFRDTLATYTGTSTSDSNRDVNLRLACEAINGIVLNPGDAFSYNDALGERTTSRGYRPGPSYSGNKTVMTVGGGICQVSSALYYCALKAEMTILLRKNHGFLPSYMPVGLDATVSWGTIDFRFKNTTDYPVRIEASANGGETTVTIVGTETRDYRVELESDILSKTEYKTTYQTMSPNNSDGYKDGDFITEPYTGYDVKTYLCKYALDSDEQISKDLIDHSKYKKRDAVVCKIETAENDDVNETTPKNSTDED